MRQLPLIRKTIAAILVLVFCLAGAPRAYFHDLVADHVDAITCADDHQTSVLHKSSFDCHCDELVVTAPFLLQSQDYSIVVIELGRHQPSSLIQSHLDLFVQYAGSRGPPSV